MTSASAGFDLRSEAARDDPGRKAGQPPRTVRWLGFIPVVIVAAVAIAGPWVVPHNPTAIVGPPSQSPSARFWFGTDSSGFDVFSRVLTAARTNVGIGAAVTVLATAGGFALGLLLGTNEGRRGPAGWLGRGAARALDLFQAVPALVIGLVVVAIFSSTRLTLVVVMALILLSPQARLVRTEVLRARSDAYLDAARMAGLSELRLTVRHVMPNSALPALQNVPVTFGATISLTAALGFLGVGLPPPAPEWGAMISNGASDIALGQWWPAGFPAVALCLTVISVSAAGGLILGRPRRR